MAPMVGMTFGAGWYDVRAGSPFEKYAGEGEETVCDACMWQDKAYTDVYGRAAPADMEGARTRDGKTVVLPAPVDADRT